LQIRKGVASIQETKEISILPNDLTIGSFGTIRTDFLVCGIGSDARGCLYNKGAVVSEALVPLDKRDLFKEGAIALETLSETTNGDADSVVMNPAC
jgi:hypothetical protein